jgi:hypothetical protein
LNVEIGEGGREGKVGVDLALLVLHWEGSFFDYAAVAFEH